MQTFRQTAYFEQIVESLFSLHRQNLSIYSIQLGHGPGWHKDLQWWPHSKILLQISKHDGNAVPHFMGGFLTLLPQGQYKG